MAQIISLAAARAERTVSAVVDTPLSDQVSQKIDSLAHQYVSPGAFLLLRQIFRFQREGRGELSYKFLCSELGGISSRTLSKYIEELETHCFVRIRRSRVSKVNATNQFEIDFKGPLGASMPALNTPRHQRLGGTVKSKVPPAGVRQKVKSNILSSKDNKIPKGIRRVAAPQFDTIADAIEQTKKRTLLNREAKVAKVNNGQLTLAGVKATWAKSMSRHHPTVPAVFFTAVEFRIFKMRLGPILAIANLSEFFDYIVENWSLLRETRFKWLRAKGKDVAISPSLPELMRFWKIFAQAFADSRMTTASNTAKLRRTGHDTLRTKLEKVEAEKAQVEAALQKLQEKLATVERVAYAKPIEEKPVESLSARRRRADATYNQDSEIPDWK